VKNIGWSDPSIFVFARNQSSNDVKGPLSSQYVKWSFGEKKKKDKKHKMRINHNLQKFNFHFECLS
jgi:hypothetical protein